MTTDIRKITAKTEANLMRLRLAVGEPFTRRTNTLIFALLIILSFFIVA